MNEEVEKRALACIRAGKLAEATKLLVECYHAPIQTAATRLLGDPHAAEDLCQQVFVEAYRDLAKFNGNSSLLSWIYGILRHRSLDEFRRRKRSILREDLDVVDKLAEPAQPDTSIDQIAMERALVHCLNRFDHETRSMFIMRYQEGLTHAEIGKAVGKEAGTVQVQLARATFKLRHCMERQGVGGDTE